VLTRKRPKWKTGGFPSERFTVRARKRARCSTWNNPIPTLGPSPFAESNPAALYDPVSLVPGHHSRTHKFPSTPPTHDLVILRSEATKDLRLSFSARLGSVTEAQLPATGYRLGSGVPMSRHPQPCSGDPSFGAPAPRPPSSSSSTPTLELLEFRHYDELLT
jgi:hypothetical protein